MSVLVLLISSILTSCSPLVVKYDNKSIKQFHERVKKAESGEEKANKEVIRIKAEYRRIYDLWNECSDVTEDLAAALAEATKEK